MLPVIAILPFWAFVYVYAPRAAGIDDALTPIELGAEVYSANCASCHGANGEGVGDFPQLAGEVLADLPEEADHVKWVQEGSQTKPKGTPYGDPAREGGQHVVELRADARVRGHADSRRARRRRPVRTRDVQVVGR